VKQAVAVALAVGGQVGGTHSRRRRPRGGTLWAFAAAVAFNAVLLALLTLGGRTGVWHLRPSREMAIRLDLFHATGQPRPQPRAATAPAAARPVAPLPTVLQPPTSTAPVAAALEPETPASPPPAAPPADAVVQGRVAAALRSLSACSQLGGRSDEDRADCGRQLAPRRDEQIDAVPTEMRQQQAAADAHRAYVMSGAAAALLPKPRGNVPDHGREISVHVECSMKFGVGASGGLHCPGMK
jgi:hypothetical protein